MSKSIWAARSAILSLLVYESLVSGAFAQPTPLPPVHFRVDGPTQRMEMIVNTSRILTLDENVPRIQVMNPEVVGAQPISPNQIQVSARTPGVTQLNLWDANEKLYSIDMLVYGDARELENVLHAQFPDASLKLNPLPSSIVISGYVPRADMVSSIVRIAEDFYPKVINNMTVGGVQQVLLHVRVMEVSRTKLRTLGFDWANINLDDFVVQNASGLIGAYSVVPGLSEVVSNGAETLSFGIMSDNNSFFGFLEALRQNNLVKVLAEPTLVTISGRPASFNSGGEFPILVPQSLGTVSIEYRQFGTRVDFLPIVLGNGSIRLEIRPTVSEIDPARSVTINNVTVPGLRTRWVDTGVEMKAGQTLALAGLIQNRIESENKGIPWVSELPWVGAAFRRVEETTNEIELLITVTPEFVDALDPHEVPPCGPGESSTSPCDTDFYWRGYLEVPKCCAQGNCGKCSHCQPHSGMHVTAPAAYGVEEQIPVEQAAPLEPVMDSPLPEPAVVPPADETSRRGSATPQVKTQSTSHSLSDYPPTSSRRNTANMRLHDQQNPANPSPTSAAMVGGSDNSQPGLIGPIGYDLRN